MTLYPTPKLHPFDYAANRFVHRWSETRNSGSPAAASNSRDRNGAELREFGVAGFRRGELPAMERRGMVLLGRIELPTSALPRMRSTTELQQHTIPQAPEALGPGQGRAIGGAPLLCQAEP